MSDSPSIAPSPSPSPSAAAAAAATRPAGRRRLWQLPRAGQECLLLWAFSPERLRQVAERAVSRLRGQPVALCGSPAELLTCVLHDLDRRNPLSEAVHDALAAQFASVAARWKGRADPEAQVTAWRQASPQERPALLWVWLTAPGGDVREEHWLTEARVAWAEEARRGAAETARARVAEARCAEQEQALAEARGRAAQRAEELHRARHEAAQEIARLRGEGERWRRRAEALEDRPVAGHELPVAGPAEVPVPRSGEGEAVTVAEPFAATAPGAAASRVEAAPMIFEPSRPDPLSQGPAPLALQGRRVLCVGGMPGAHRRYQAVVERAGARFAYHDGGVEHGVDRLTRQLAAADVVVCQSGCLNHEAYQRVKRHCRRAGTPCLYVERPSLTLFARTLGLVPSPEARAS
jgi:hypothetical protein